MRWIKTVCISGEVRDGSLSAIFFLMPYGNAKSSGSLPFFRTGMLNKFFFVAVPGRKWRKFAVFSSFPRGNDQQKGFFHHSRVGMVTKKNFSIVPGQERPKFATFSTFPAGNG